MSDPVREVAIKVLPPELAVQPALRERFVREAKLAASLSHPNIVHVYAVEEQGELLAFVMEYVDGETLTERVARSGPYDAQDCARLLQDTAWALGYAHARGIVHRDVKPDNLLIERGTGRALIMDFGIARHERASNLTEVGHSIGTPHYMSPEQAAAEQVDGRSDLYSLGCVGFFAATGRPPFEAESAHKLLMLSLIFGLFWQFSDKAETILGSMVAVLFATVTFTIVTQALDRVRFAVRQGFTVEDVRAAFGAIALWTQRPVRVTLAQRAANRIWVSSAGRAIFARAERRYAAEIAR